MNRNTLNRTRADRSTSLVTVVIGVAFLVFLAVMIGHELNTVVHHIAAAINPTNPA